MKKETYLRFIVLEIDQRTKKNKGLFTLAYELLDNLDENQSEAINLSKILNWFYYNLTTPDRLSRKKNVSHRETKGLSWVKSSSIVVVKKLYELKQYVENHGYTVDVLKSKTPGYIVYEDSHQIVAEPFNR